MSVAPEYFRGPFTALEYAALPEDSDVRFELQEGHLVMSPSPLFRHQKFVSRLANALDVHAPPSVEVAPDVDVDLQLVPDDQPGFVRRPDVLVVSAAASARQAVEGGLLRAEDVVLAVEVFSPSSRRTDSVIKFAEYLEAGIPHYWTVDLEGRPSLRAFRLTGAAYRDLGAFTGVVELSEPFAVRLDLDALAA